MNIARIEALLHEAKNPATAEKRRNSIRRALLGAIDKNNSEHDNNRAHVSELFNILTTTALKISDNMVNTFAKYCTLTNAGLEPEVSPTDDTTPTQPLHI